MPPRSELVGKAFSFRKYTPGYVRHSPPTEKQRVDRKNGGMRLLLIEDSRDLAANVADYLEAAGALVDYAPDGVTGLHLAATGRYDAVVLDVALPGLDGVSVCERLRGAAENPVPVIMLTARDTEQERLAGFAAGADDYITKPFSLPELHARLKAVIRRSQGPIYCGLRVGDLSFDPATLVARRGNRRLHLTPSGTRLLEKLMRAAPAVVSRADLEHLLWGDNPPDSDATLRGHIHALRAEIDRGEAEHLLHTHHGLGYRLAVGDGD